jgi:hypothetical protein
VFIATTNKPVKELQEPLQTRFQVWKFEPLQASTITDLLVQRYPMLPHGSAALDRFQSIRKCPRGTYRRSERIGCAEFSQSNGEGGLAGC